MDRLNGLEGTFNTKFNGVNTSLMDLTGKFDRLLERVQARIPAPVLHGNTASRAGRVPREDPGASVASAAAPGIDTNLDDYETEVDNPQSRCRPCQHPCNNLQQAQVHDDDHLAKLKLNVPPFEGRYNPDAYLTWELEVEQRFACLNYPEERHVCAATCEFTGFTSVWWSEHCRMFYDNIPTTWTALKTTMHTRFVPPYYQCELLQNLTKLQQGRNYVEEYYQELQTGLIRCGIVEDDEAMFARFLGGLNKPI